MESLAHFAANLQPFSADVEGGFSKMQSLSCFSMGTKQLKPCSRVVLYTSPNMTCVTAGWCFLLAVLMLQMVPYIHPRQAWRGHPTRNCDHQEMESQLTPNCCSGTCRQGKSMSQEHPLHWSEREDSRSIIMKNNCYSNRISSSTKQKLLCWVSKPLPLN